MPFKKVSFANKPVRSGDEVVYPLDFEMTAGRNDKMRDISRIVERLEVGKGQYREAAKRTLDVYPWIHVEKREEDEKRCEKLAAQQIQLLRDELRGLMGRAIGELTPINLAKLFVLKLSPFFNSEFQNDQDRLLVYTDGNIADPDTLIAMVGESRIRCFNVFSENLEDEITDPGLLDQLGGIIRRDEIEEISGTLNPLASYWSRKIK